MISDDDSYTTIMAIIMIIDVIVVMVVRVNVSILIKNTIVLSIVFDNIEL